VQAINHLELKSVVDFLESLKGSELQKVSGPLEALCFHFWAHGPRFLVLSCLKQKPSLFYFEDKAMLDSSLRTVSPQRPMILFLKAHFLGQFVKEVKIHNDHPRVFEIHFENASILECRLFSGGGNLGAFKDGKQVFLRKPQKLRGESESDYSPDLIRSPQVIFEQGIESLRLSKAKESSKKLDDEDKIAKAKAKIKQALKELENKSFQRLALALESNQKLSPDLKKLYKENLSKRENIERAYEKTKISEVKKKRLLERLASLEKNLKKETKVAVKKTKTNQLNVGAFFQLNDKVVLRCGRNAKENLELLRKAKPWHIWMHLSDYPSGHLIVDLPKDYSLEGKDLEKCAHFLFLKGAPKKLLKSPTQKYEVMFTECRFVKAQKKNKGLVTTQKHSSMTMIWQSEFMHIF
jgi:hypothetical protein